MFRPLKLILMPVLLGSFLDLDSWMVSCLELTVHAGDPALLGCVFQGIGEKPVAKVDWIFSAGGQSEEYVLYYYANLSVPVGRFQSRVSLAGDLSRSDGSLLLRNVQADDQGTYTCEIRLEMESQVFKKTVVLQVLPEEPKELVVRVGDAARMGCVLQSTEGRLMTKVHWVFSSEKHTQEELLLSCHPQLGAPKGCSPTWGRFQNRVTLVGDPARNDGSITLQGAQESDGGSYSCSVHLGNLTVQKTVVLHVVQKEPRTSVTSVAHRAEPLGGDQLVIIVGIVCATVLMLPVLILLVMRTHRNKRSVTPTALVKGLENTQKAPEEKHVYSSLITRDVTEEEDPSDRSEATYMTMQPVWPSLRPAPSNPPEKPAGGVPGTQPAF
ncbi:junctional adhesion molecule-like isoform 1-T6 [Molossus nigricans]